MEAVPLITIGVTNVCSSKERQALKLIRRHVWDLAVNAFDSRETQSDIRCQMGKACMWGDGNKLR